MDGKQFLISAVMYARTSSPSRLPLILQLAPHTQNAPGQTVNDVVPPRQDVSPFAGCYHPPLEAFDRFGKEGPWIAANLQLVPSPHSQALC